MRGPYCIGWGRAACKAPRYAEPPSYTTAKPLQQHNDPCSISRTNLWKSSHARYNQAVIPEPNALWSLGWRSVSNPSAFSSALCRKSSRGACARIAEPVVISSTSAIRPRILKCMNRHH